MNKDKWNVFGALIFLKQFMNKLYLKFSLFYLGRLVCMLEETIVPVFVAIMINQMVYYKNIDTFVKVGIVFFVMSLLSCLIYYLAYELYIDGWGKIVERVRKAMYRRQLYMNAEDMANVNYGDLSQQIQYKATECGDLVVKSVLNNINCYINIAICLLVVYRMSILVGVLFTITVPISVFVSMKYGGKVRKERRKFEQAHGRYVSWLYEVFGRFKDLRLMSAEDFTKQKMNEHQDEMINADVKAGIATLVSQSIIENVNVWVRMVLYAFLALISFRQGMLIGDITIVLAYFTTTVQKLNIVCENYMYAQARLAAIARLKDILEMPLAEEPADAVPISVTRGEVIFKDVEFAYRGKENVIDGLSLEVKAGEKVAIVGESGCGKSTLSYILLGFYPVKKGKIFVDGMDISQSTISSLRKEIAVVQQEVLIFEGTIRENILVGKPDATEAEMIAACKAAEAYDFVMKMEKGFDTVLGGANKKLSGGQKQRISIARAYLKNPALLVFDEATASLDNETETQIHANWGKVLDGKTAIVITHRQSAVMLCDRVALMENGRFVEEDTPQNMLANSERFRRLFAVKEEVVKC
ncbi:MAG: ABC transporter ATP-binding protein [Ruminiclostridium sp.]|nr:ABC transporter ATP-binding protein [Ruminiclostridium sp.]